MGFATLTLAVALLASGGDDKSFFDELTREQAIAEREVLESGQPHAPLPAMTVYAETALRVKYPSGEFNLPGYLYKPAGVGPFPAVIWNHGSERNPKGQPELARFYTQQGYVFFVPIRHGHARAPGVYIGTMQDDLGTMEHDLRVVQKKIVALHELYNHDVVAAVAWLKTQSFIDPERLAMSGVSYGGIQTLLAAEKGLNLRAFVPFAPAAMSYANVALRERLVLAVQHAKAPIFLLQAQNDYSTGPSELLTPLMQARGDASRAQLYPAFGYSHQQGHGAFACWSAGITVWGKDVVGFLDSVVKSKTAVPADGKVAGPRTVRPK
jgi:carboxymethylenebutenolidase